MKTFEIIIKTSFGLEDVLIKELESSGYKNVQKLNRAVQVTGTLEDVYRFNYTLRTANKILLPVAEFSFKNEEDLYKKTKQIPWENYFSNEMSFKIGFTVYSDLIKNTQFAALKVKDAIVDRFREETNKRPNVEKINPDVKINLHISDSKCTLSLDSSGEPLFKRGYRFKGGEAPLKEDLAAGIILLSEWDKQTTFYDLFCGSGTLLIEAAMIATNTPSGYFRRSFGFQNWLSYDAELFNNVKKEVDSNIVSTHIKFYGVERNLQQIRLARTNVQQAGFIKNIKLIHADFLQFEPETDSGYIISNLPFGERLTELEQNELNDMYQDLGTYLKHHCIGFGAALFSSNKEAVNHIGLKPKRKYKLFNGKIEATLYLYELYKGSLKGNSKEEDIKTNF
jgi:putative N6-adenine-specific DNA methylase